MLIRPTKTGLVLVNGDVCFCILKNEMYNLLIAHLFYYPLKQCCAASSLKASYALAQARAGMVFLQEILVFTKKGA